MKRIKKLYLFMTIGAAIGIVASFWQTLEKLTLLKNPDAILSCNLNGVFSCSNVLNSHQASLFGFPNSIMSLMFFIVFLTVAIVGLSGGLVTKKMRFSIHFLSFFVLLFGLWFLHTSTYSIKSICIFCIFNFLGLLVINYAWLRQNASDVKWMKNLTKKGLDIFIWILCALLLASAILFQFYI
ncbi:MAG: vitamin K epoxide reductase family protein [Candidatus Saccharibacteria bacterium]